MIQKRIFIMLFVGLISNLFVSYAYAWEAKNIKLSNVRIENNSIVGFDISLEVPGYLGEATSWIGIQIEEFHDGDFTNFGNINNTYNFRSLSELKNNSSFMNEYGIIGFAPGDDNGFPCFGSYTVINQSPRISNIPLNKEKNYYIYLWTLYYGDEFYPDAYLGKLYLDGKSNFTIYDSSDVSGVIDGFHTVTFNTNGGSVVANQTVQNLQKIYKPENPLKDGYSFIGWYSDSNLETEFNFDTLVAEDMTVFAKWGKKYNILEGENQIYTIGSNTNIVIKTDGELNKLSSIMLDDSLVNQEYYTVDNSSSTLTLKNTFLETLDEGNHTIKLVYSDGTTSTTFTIVNDTNNSESNPPTADYMILCVSILLLSFFVLFGVVVYSKNKKNSQI